MVTANIRQCSIANCGREYRARGYCTLHYNRLVTGKCMTDAPKRANGQGCISGSGYVVLSTGGKRRMAHVEIAEKALGKPLPKGALVHHWNEIRTDNRPTNLAIFPSHSYHFLIHRRMRAMAACGHADWRKCRYCKQYDAPENVTVSGIGDVDCWHKVCAAKYARDRSFRVVL